MNIAIAFIIGLIVGFIVEWAFDFLFLRNKSRKLGAELEQVRGENNELKAQVTFLETGESLDEELEEEVTLDEPTGEGEFIYEEEQITAEDIETGDKVLPDDDIDHEGGEEESEENEWAPTETRSSGITMSEVATAGIAAAVLLGDEPPSDEDDLEGGVVAVDEESNEESESMEETSPETQEPDSVEDSDKIVDTEWVLEGIDEEESPEPEGPMMAGAKARQDIEFIEGIGPTYGSLLREIGIDNPQALLERGATRKGRSDIAEETAIPDTFILKWVNQVDLYRIKGIGSEYAEILEVAGVDTVLELAQRNPENLYNKLVQINSEHQRVRQLPGINQVEDWVKQAKELPRIVSY